jgi:hypothetical protein
MAAASTAFSHARRKKPRTYTTDDVQSFVLVNMMMGVVEIPEVVQYWRGQVKQPEVTSIFPNFSKFRDLCVDLHAIDTSVVPPAQQSEKNKQDSFWKLGDFLFVMSELFRYHRIPLRDLTIDEFTIAFKGRHAARCFNKDKPEKYHLKGFSVNETKSGYCLSFYMYRGKDEKRPKDITATMWPMTVLLGPLKGCHNAGYIVWADNWFTGIGTVGECVKLGIDYVGTSRTNRQGDAFGKTTAIDTKGWERGTYRAKKATINGVDLYATQWQDSKLVSMISTLPSVLGKTTRKQVHKTTKQYSNVELDIPSIYSAYNFGKVGTDRMDQVVACYYRNCRYHWHVKTILHIFSIAIMNAYITYLDIVGKTRQEYRYLDFVLDVINELKPPTPAPIAPMHVHTPIQPGRAKVVKRRANQEKREFNTAQTHAERNKRMTCRECGGSTINRCLECDIPLCVNTTNSGKTCWSDWHKNK